MYECPNCAGNLKFSISEQMLHCEYCDTTVDPYSFHKEQDAEEQVVIDENINPELLDKLNKQEYQMTVFTCPQCGGEILSDDVTAATFCSFCGAATILDSRISKESCPKYILPFTKTKEDCQRAYVKMMRRSLFAPKELKDEENISKFRGIYMPYWIYNFTKKGPISYNGSRNYRRGNYRYTEHYDVTCDVDAKYEGIAYDAASSFSDRLSRKVSFFDYSKMKAFVPGFLSGFYADTKDIDKWLYYEEAEEIVVEDGVERISDKSRSMRYEVNATTLKEAIRPSGGNVEFAFLPMWYLAYRKNDRVCYAVVNGQTGKIEADVPLDLKKYLIGSLLLAIPLFILLNLFFTIPPMVVLILALILAGVSLAISNRQLNTLFARESNGDDKGFVSVHGEASDSESQQTEEIKNKLDIPQNDYAVTLRDLLLKMVLIFAMLFVMMGGFFLSIVAMGSRQLNLGFLVGFQFIVINIFAIFLRKPIKFKSKKNKVKQHFSLKKKMPYFIKPLIGILIAVLVALFNPVQDIYFYLGVFVCMGSVLWAILDIIKLHNELTTRKLPQFNKRGGDLDA